MTQEISIKEILHQPNKPFEIPISDLIKKYSSNIAWAIDRLKKSTAGTRGILDINDIEGGPQLNGAVAALIAQGYANYINNNFNSEKRGAFIGFDPRYFSREFAQIFTRVFLANGLKVYRDKDEIHTSTPVTSYMAYHFNLASGIIITSSHNPPNQNGIKSSTSYGGVDTDQTSAKIASEIQRLYDDGALGKGKIKIAPYDAGRINFVESKTIYYENYLSRIFGEEFSERMKAAMENGARFIFDGLYGVGGLSIEYYLNRIFKKYDWKNKVIVTNAVPDAAIGRIERPDPSRPETLEYSGVLERLADTDGVLIAVTADMDADRIGTAVIIQDKDIGRAKKHGLFVSQMQFKKKKVNIVRFTPNQIFTLIAYDRVLQAYEKFLGTRDIKSIDEAIRDRRVPELYLITSIPTSMIAKTMIERFGGTAILTAVGFKNLGYQAQKLDAENPKAIVIALMEESGGANIGPIGKRDTRGSGIHRDKDTIALALALFDAASRLFLDGKNLLDSYIEMAENLGGLFYYERLDAYLPDQKTAESLNPAEAKTADGIKQEVIGKFRAIDNVEGNLDKPENIKLLFELFGKNYSDMAQTRQTVVPNTVLLVGEGNKWDFITPKTKSFRFKGGEILEVFHAGREDQEGPSISIYDKNGKLRARALMRPSGTESLIRVYMEIFEPHEDSRPENLYKYFHRLLSYLGMDNYKLANNKDSYLSEYIEQVNAKYDIRNTPENIC